MSATNYRVEGLKVFYREAGRTDAPMLQIQLDLFGDYKSNVALYPEFQNYFRKHKPPFLAVWGKNDPFFLPAGAEAFKLDMPHADARFYDTGHFALETHCNEIASAIREFLVTPSETQKRTAQAR